MSFRQRKSRPSLLSTLWRRPGPARDRRRGHPGPIVTRLEERTLMTTPTVTTLADSAAALTYGQTEMFTATVATNGRDGTTPAGGSVTFMDGTTTLGIKPLVDGTAQLSVTSLGAGSHEVTASYSGTGAFGASSTPVTPTPVISTVAGGGNSAARSAFYGLSTAAAVAVDSSGDLFIAEGISYSQGKSQEVCEVNHSTGAVTVVAGNGTGGYSGDGGPATAAELFNPSALALDDSGESLHRRQQQQCGPRGQPEHRDHHHRRGQRHRGRQWRRRSRHGRQIVVSQRPCARWVGRPLHRGCPRQCRSRSQLEDRHHHYRRG